MQRVPPARAERTRGLGKRRRVPDTAAPSVGDVVRATDIYCRTFRHAQFKGKAGRWRFVNPHASREVCEGWVRDGLIDGCGKPFRFDGKTVERCGYV